jgi:hypothetical protein
MRCRAQVRLDLPDCAIASAASLVLFAQWPHIDICLTISGSEEAAQHIDEAFHSEQTKAQHLWSSTGKLAVVAVRLEASLASSAISPTSR